MGQSVSTCDKTGDLKYSLSAELERDDDATGSALCLPSTSMTCGCHTLNPHTHTIQLCQTHLEQWLAQL
jgi:hypothetical protein